MLIYVLEDVCQLSKRLLVITAGMKPSSLASAIAKRPAMLGVSSGTICKY